MVVVTGKIRGKARPRICRGHAFTPKDTVQYEKLVRNCYKQQDGRYLEGPIKALIIAYYKIPKSYSKKRVQAIRDELEKPTKKPDVDNIAKIILDSLNGVAYKDDSQIVDLRIIKSYTEETERVEFELI
ncbi:RusA family crossover junction endodeoxyribonuclease [Clostridium perfringens]|uniref:RusA family crossover junction endodeoxyribonuclease n=1 Tax=Clostridium perfringens TaxID=1502 RepID=UPI0024BC003F|nr:RusA family crossover junction endodeoxyribonuclease [Clostridium perfringens]EJT5921733.1 RusA family crossover junction endodeoxyribonuclease [Clostridium perfringens]MDU6311261.1 RusA family crossover junction endodeoxyribonuclease [Clostridium perfringens]